MTWPTGSVSTTQLDAGGDDPALARADLKSAVDKLNQIIAHATTVGQALLAAADAAAARTALGVPSIAGDTFTGSVTVTGTLSATTVLQTSDERAKENWRPAPEVLAELVGLETVGLFDWRDGSGESLGIGAQSLERLLPQAVHTDQDGKKAVNYGPLALVLLIEMAKQVQALQGEVLKLRSAQ